MACQMISIGRSPRKRRPSRSLYLASLLLVHVAQLIYLFQDLYLEVLNNLLRDFWALLKSSDSPSVIVNRQDIVDLGNNLFLSIAL